MLLLALVWGGHWSNNISWSYQQSWHQGWTRHGSWSWEWSWLQQTVAEMKTLIRNEDWSGSLLFSSLQKWTHFWLIRFLQTTKHSSSCLNNFTSWSSDELSAGQGPSINWSDVTVNQEAPTMISSSFSATPNQAWQFIIENFSQLIQSIGSMHEDFHFSLHTRTHWESLIYIFLIASSNPLVTPEQRKKCSSSVLSASQHQCSVRLWSLFPDNK